MKRPFLVIGPAVDGRDRWSFGFGSTVHRIYKAPSWLSFGRYYSTIKT